VAGNTNVTQHMLHRIFCENLWYLQNVLAEPEFFMSFPWKNLLRHKVMVGRESHAQNGYDDPTGWRKGRKCFVYPPHLNPE